MNRVISHKAVKCSQRAGSILGRVVASQAEVPKLNLPNVMSL